MQEKIEIKKSTGLDDFSTFSSYSGDKVERKSSIEVVGSGNLEKVYREYIRLLNSNNTGLLKKISSKYLITPEEFNPFIAFSLSMFEHPDYRRKTGYYVSSLIQNSYDLGNNNFNFDFQKKIPLDCFAYSLKGLRDNPIKINVLGGVGNICGEHAKNLNILIENNLGINSFYDSNNLIVKVKGNVSKSFGNISNNLDVLVEGNVGEYFLSSSVNCKAKIYGSILDKHGNFGNASTNLYSIIEGDIIVNRARLFDYHSGSKIYVRRKDVYDKALKNITMSRRKLNWLQKLFNINFADGYNKLAYIGEDGRVKKSILFEE